MPTSNNVQNSRKQIQFENKTAVPEISKKLEDRNAYIVHNSSVDKSFNCICSRLAVPINYDDLLYR